jgi:hypothetical protein
VNLAARAAIPRRKAVTFYFCRATENACRASDSQVLVGAFPLSRYFSDEIHAQKMKVAVVQKRPWRLGFREWRRSLSSKNRDTQIFLTAL